ncbi:MAG: hypothetical protein GY951_07390 [Psychromonas sp.]|nr:hypothetical protein [Psychromonas sp.]
MKIINLPSSNNLTMIFNHAVFNGQLVSYDDTKISIFNDAYFSSFGVYEAIKIDQGRPFYLTEHLHRLIKSADMIELSLDVDVSTLTQWCHKLISLDTSASWSLKIIVLGATSAHTSSVIAIQPAALTKYSDELYTQGCAAILYQGERTLPACKSLNTLVNYLARQKAVSEGTLEGLLHHNGYLTEGSRTNLFAVQEGQLVTSPATDVLSGITRDVILQVMQDTSYSVVEIKLSTDISLYEEFFISSTSMHVMPVTHINNQPIGNGQVGPITKTVMAQFNKHYQQVISGE